MSFTNRLTDSLTIDGYKYLEKLTEKEYEILAQAKSLIPNNHWEAAIQYLIDMGAVISSIKNTSSIKDLTGTFPVAVNKEKFVIYGDFKNSDTPITKPFAVLYSGCVRREFKLFIWNPDDETKGDITNLVSNSLGRMEGAA